MSAKRTRRRKGGAPRKVPGGLDRVLFVRADQALIDKLENLRLRQSEQSGVVVSMADVARSILRDGIERAESEDGAKK